MLNGNQQSTAVTAIRICVRIITNRAKSGRVFHELLNVFFQYFAHIMLIRITQVLEYNTLHFKLSLNTLNTLKSDFRQTPFRTRVKVVPLMNMQIDGNIYKIYREIPCRRRINLHVIRTLGPG